MKKKIGIISVVLVIVIAIISTILVTNKDDNKSINLDNGIAYYYETDNGNYTQGSSNAWSTGEYVLDIEDSSCNGEDDPVDLIDWDAKSNGVLLKAKENISCTLYFDRMTEQEKFFEDLLGPSGKGNLLYHNSQLENGANDHGYRFSGDDPNNFICFGPGSEKYNSGQNGEQCPDGNLYRIIGYVPVELQNGEIDFRVKVIKSEYATKEDLGKDKAYYIMPFDSTYKDLKRVKKEDYIEGFQWNGDEDKEDNTWGSSTLYQALNSNEKSFLKNLNNWESKIEDVQWNVGGKDEWRLPKAKEAYNEEWSITYGAKTKVSAKIGLMYPSDYGFASEQKSWTADLIYYNNNMHNYGAVDNENRENNWLFNAVYEWTISRLSDDYCDAFDIDDWGSTSNDNVGSSGNGVRPAFYLNSSVTLSGGDGSYEKPYKVS